MTLCQRALRMWLAGGALVTLGLSSTSRAELGWTETEYVKRLGPAGRSPLTPNEARFAAPGGGSVVVIFAEGRSREEIWLVDRDTSFVPPALLKQAQAAVQGTPVRRVEFHLEGAPAAEIFEVHDEHVTLQVDYRNHAVVRIGLCRAAEPCTLVDRLLAMERMTDDLGARTQEQMRRETR